MVDKTIESKVSRSFSHNAALKLMERYRCLFSKNPVAKFDIRRGCITTCPIHQFLGGWKLRSKTVSLQSITSGAEVFLEAEGKPLGNWLHEKQITMWQHLKYDPLKTSIYSQKYLYLIQTYFEFIFDNRWKSIKVFDQ